jgi:hypothetical protein
MTDCLVSSSSESDVLADCCRRHSQRKKVKEIMEMWERESETQCAGKDERE